MSSLRIELHTHISSQQAVNLIDLPDPSHCLLDELVLIYSVAEIKYAISGDISWTIRSHKVEEMACLDFITSQDGDIFFLIYSPYFYSPLELNGTSETCWKASLGYDFTLGSDHSSRA